MAGRCTADHCVTVTFKNPKPFGYDEEPDRITDPDKQEADHDDTMSWMSNDGDITITFTDPKGNPCDHANGSPALKAKKGQWTTPPVTLRGYSDDQKGAPYKYSVTINNVTDDPTIIFDDAGLVDVNIDATRIDAYAKTALGTFQGLLKEIKATAGSKREKDGLLFSGGIDNIQVQVKVPALNVDVNITVSGPKP
jgi:hypothetical protein